MGGKRSRIVSLYLEGGDITPNITHPVSDFCLYLINIFPSSPNLGEDSLIEDVG
jgi:hypothetical protein